MGAMGSDVAIETADVALMDDDLRHLADTLCEVARGVGCDPPPGGYESADMIFFGHGPGNDGHVALYLGDGQIVQCSSSGNGSNFRVLPVERGLSAPVVPVSGRLQGWIQGVVATPR
jgi:cell wall-associated NlpC family hydrolase